MRDDTGVDALARDMIYLLPRIIISVPGCKIGRFDERDEQSLSF